MAGGHDGGDVLDRDARAPEGVGEADALNVAGAERSVGSGPHDAQADELGDALERGAGALRELRGGHASRGSQRKVRTAIATPASPQTASATSEPRLEPSVSPSTKSARTRRRR